MAFSGGIIGKTSVETWEKFCSDLTNMDVGITEDLLKRQFYISDEGENIRLALSSNGVLCMFNIIENFID